jgi:hypothetical protein
VPLARFSHINPATVTLPLQQFTLILLLLLCFDRAMLQPKETPIARACVT